MSWWFMIVQHSSRAEKSPGIEMPALTYIMHFSTHLMYVPRPCPWTTAKDYIASVASGTGPLGQCNVVLVQPHAAGPLGS
jgi:hypothetical protein